MATEPTSKDGDGRRPRLIKNGPESDTIAGRLELIRHAWDSGTLSYAAVEGLHYDLALREGIDETLQLLEDPWRTELFDTLKYWACADPSERPIHIFGGVYAFEYERDPVKAAQLGAKTDAERAANTEYFMKVLRPRINEWWSKQPKPR